MLVGMALAADHRAAAPAGDHDAAQLRPGAAHRRRHRGAAVDWPAGAARHGLRQPHRVLRHHRRRLRRHRRADRVRLRHRHHVVSRPYQFHAASVVVNRMDEGMSQPAAAVGADVRVPRPADGDDRHRARDGGVPRGAGRPCARRPVVCAAGCDVPGVRHLGLEGGRHGRGGAGAVPRDAPSRLASRRACGAAGEFQRDVGDDPAQPGADHHRLGDQRVDHRAVHRRSAAGGGGGDRAGGGELVPLASHGHRRRPARAGVADGCARSSSRSPD